MRNKHIKKLVLILLGIVSFLSLDEYEIDSHKFNFSDQDLENSNSYNDISINKYEESSFLEETDSFNELNFNQANSSNTNSVSSQKEILEDQNENNQNDMSIESELKLAIDQGLIKPTQSEDFLAERNSIQDLLIEKIRKEETEVIDDDSISI